MIPGFLAPSFFHSFDCDTHSAFHAVRFEKGTRYYTIILDKDLFDDWVVTIVNGRIDTKLGKIRKIAFSCFSDAFDQFITTTKTRTKRGYSLDSYKTWDPLVAAMDRKKHHV